MESHDRQNLTRDGTLMIMIMMGKWSRPTPLSSPASVGTPKFPLSEGRIKKTWGTTVMKMGRQSDDSPPVVIRLQFMIGQIRPFRPCFVGEILSKILSVAFRVVLIINAAFLPPKNFSI